PPAPAGQGAARVRQAAAHRARAALVHRRSFPPPHRTAAQPRRDPQRPAPLHLLRRTRQSPLPAVGGPNPAGALQHLVVNACILSATGYLQDAITGRGGASDAAIALLSPAHFEAINPYGDMRFDVAAILART